MMTAGIQDSRQYGPPGDIGTFMFPATVIVFQFSFSGLTYTSAIHSKASGWALVSTPIIAGVTDNVVIQAAVDYIGSLGSGRGGVCYIEAGTYVIISSIIIRRGAVPPPIWNYTITIRGEGKQATYLHGDIAGDYIIKFEQGEQFGNSICEMRIKNDNAAGHCIYAPDVYDSEFRNLLLYAGATSGDGIVFDRIATGCYYNQLYNVDVLSGLRGIVFLNSTNENKVFGGRIELGVAAGKTGIYVNANNVSLFGVSLESNNIGINATGNCIVKAYACRFENCITSWIGTVYDYGSRYGLGGTEAVFYANGTGLINKLNHILFSDMYATLQLAINAMVAGDILYIASGTFNEVIIISGKTHLNIIGAGPEKTIIDGAITGNALTLDSSSNCMIENIGLKTTAGAGNTYRGLSVINASQYNLFNLIDVISSDDSGIYSSPNDIRYGNTFSNIRILSADAYGIRFISNNDAVYWSNCIFSNIKISNTGEAGIIAYRCRNNCFSNIIVNTPTGVNKNGIEVGALGVNNTFTGLSLMPSGNGLPYTDVGTGNKWTRPAGYVYDNRVSAIITALNTSIVFAHGCNYTPAAGDIHPTLTNLPTAPIGDVYVDTIGAVNATLHCTTPPGVATAIFDVAIIKTP